jgi:uncharacterized Zn-binding protein involved in type VI secretion
VQPIARLNSLCSAATSPQGPCVGICYGRIIDASAQVYVNGAPVATNNSQIAYSGMIYPYSGGSPIYVTWTGRVLNSNSSVYVDGKQVATVGTATDSGGYILEGESTIYA